MNNKKGFTLIEATIAVSLISVLCLALFTIYSNSLAYKKEIEKAYEDTKVANLAIKQIMDFIERNDGVISVNSVKPTAINIEGTNSNIALISGYLFIHTDGKDIQENSALKVNNLSLKLIRNENNLPSIRIQVTVGNTNLITTQRITLKE